MAARDTTRETGSRTTDRTATRTEGTARHTSRRKSTETKASFKTTEFLAYVGMLAAIFIAGFIVESSDSAGLGAKQVWFFATILTIGYMISRGLAKMGSRDPYDD